MLALPKPCLELSEAAALRTILSPGKLHRDMKEQVKLMCETLPEAGFSLVYVHGSTQISVIPEGEIRTMALLK